MVEIAKIKSLTAKFKALEKKFTQGNVPSVMVGYTANYAIYVHERQAKHAPGKQWKFLEQPARQLGPTLVQIIVIALNNGVPLLEALYLAGLRLQKASQKLVPVKTGNLRASAFVARENELLTVAAESKKAFKANRKISLKAALKASKAKKATLKKARTKKAAQIKRAKIKKAKAKLRKTK